METTKCREATQGCVCKGIGEKIDEFEDLFLLSQSLYIGYEILPRMFMYMQSQKKSLLCTFYSDSKVS